MVSANEPGEPPPPLRLSSALRARYIAPFTVGLVLGAGAVALIEWARNPSDYAECVLDNISKATTQNAAAIIRSMCKELYPMPASRSDEYDRFLDAPVR